MSFALFTSRDRVMPSMPNTRNAHSAWMLEVIIWLDHWVHKPARDLHPGTRLFARCNEAEDKLELIWVCQSCGTSSAGHAGHLQSPFHWLLPHLSFHADSDRNPVVLFPSTTIQLFRCSMWLPFCRFIVMCV
jgi:hypothetical protein